MSNLQHVTGAGANLSNYTYTYDLASRVTTEKLNGTVTTYSYDATNQLTNDGSAYTYDLNGNRTMTGYQTGPGNQLLNDGTWGYVYDNNGNVIKKSKGASAETWTYGYDNANHLLWARDAATDGGDCYHLGDVHVRCLGQPYPGGRVDAGFGGGDHDPACLRWHGRLGRPGRQQFFDNAHIYGDDVNDFLAR